MSTSQPATTPPPPQTYRQIAATHIATLSEINAQLPKLLAYFAAAISQLSSAPIATALSRDRPDALRARQDSIWLMTRYLGMNIALIRGELAAQIDDLERYGVITNKVVKFGAAEGDGKVRNGGYGEFDVGWLNARVSEGAGVGDVVGRVRGVVEEIMRREGVEMSGEGGGGDMAVDG